MSETETIARRVRTAKTLMSKARTDEALRTLATENLGSAFESAGIDDDASGYTYRFDVESGEQRLTTDGASSMAYVFSAAGEMRVEPLHREDPDELSDEELLNAAGGSTLMNMQMGFITKCMGEYYDGKPPFPKNCNADPMNTVTRCRCSNPNNAMHWPCYIFEMMDASVPCDSIMGDGGT